VISDANSLKLTTRSNLLTAFIITLVSPIQFRREQAGILHSELSRFKLKSGQAAQVETEVIGSRLNAQSAGIA